MPLTPSESWGLTHPTKVTCRPTSEGAIPARRPAPTDLCVSEKGLVGARFNPPAPPRPGRGPGWGSQDGWTVGGTLHASSHGRARAGSPHTRAAEVALWGAGAAEGAARLASVGQQRYRKRSTTMFCHLSSPTRTRPGPSLTQPSLTQTKREDPHAYFATGPKPPLPHAWPTLEERLEVQSEPLSVP